MTQNPSIEGTGSGRVRLQRRKRTAGCKRAGYLGELHSGPLPAAAVQRSCYGDALPGSRRLRLAVYHHIQSANPGPPRCGPWQNVVYRATCSRAEQSNESVAAETNPVRMKYTPDATPRAAAHQCCDKFGDGPHPPLPSQQGAGRQIVSVLSCCHGCPPRGSQAVVGSEGQGGGDGVVSNVDCGLGQQGHIAGDAGQPPVVLVLKVAPVAPSHHLRTQAVCPSPTTPTR